MVRRRVTRRFTRLQNMYNVLKFSKKWWNNVKKSIYRNRNATANFVNLISTSTVHVYCTNSNFSCFCSRPTQRQLCQLIVEKSKRPSTGNRKGHMTQHCFVTWRHHKSRSIQLISFALISMCHKFWKIKPRGFKIVWQLNNGQKWWTKVVKDIRALFVV